MRAEELARTPGHVGAVAFSRRRGGLDPAWLARAIMDDGRY